MTTQTFLLVTILLFLDCTDVTLQSTLRPVTEFSLPAGDCLPCLEDNCASCIPECTGGNDHSNCLSCLLDRCSKCVFLCTGIDATTEIGETAGPHKPSTQCKSMTNTIYTQTTPTTIRLNNRIGAGSDKLEIEWRVKHTFQANNYIKNKTNSILLTSTSSSSNTVESILGIFFKSKQMIISVTGVKNTGLNTINNPTPGFTHTIDICQSLFDKDKSFHIHVYVNKKLQISTLANNNPGVKDGVSIFASGQDYATGRPYVPQDGTVAKLTIQTQKPSKKTTTQKPSTHHTTRYSTQ